MRLAVKLLKKKQPNGNSKKEHCEVIIGKTKDSMQELEHDAHRTLQGH